MPELVSRNYPLMIAGAMAASLLQILDTTIANVALPHMQSSLGVTVDTITRVLTSYIIASAVALPVTGWLSDRIGARTLFIGSVADFILASMMCGLAQTAHADLGINVTAATGSVIDFSTVDRFQALGDRALVLLDAEVTRQAAMIAYIHHFWAMMWITLAAAPLAFLMRKNKRPGEPVALSE
ncbi:MFS transporter [Erythrobacter sp. WG]|uniref:MFS transporter n=1 Tax=Erythrobacter sp. WG TaxID=2985510 RepID=UPI002B4BF1CA|nr:MFS transporter [Erythrobacter sp. WG]